MSIEVAVCEHVSGCAQSVDGGEQLCTLAGWSGVGKLEGFVVVGVHIAEDAAGCFSVWVAVVSTGAISGDDDGITVGSARLLAVTPVGFRTSYEFDFLVMLTTVITDPACITSAKHETLVGDVAFEITQVIACIPDLGWNVTTGLWVLTHLGCWLGLELTVYGL